MMRKETIRISERDFMFVVAGQIYEQSPNRQPRKAEIIMLKVRDAFRKEAYNDNEFYTVNIQRDELYEWIKRKLFSIQEFRELNLTQEEFERGVSVDDELRPRYSITTAFDVHNLESWRKDFVDLDAFVQNVYGRIQLIIESEEDCFLCIHQDREKRSTLDSGNSDICKMCSVNRNLKDCYEGERNPRGKYTFACRYNCFKNRYICCEECDEKGSCKCRCDGKSEDCGNAINKKKDYSEMVDKDE